jgi:hypothetical protein
MITVVAVLVTVAVLVGGARVLRSRRAARALVSVPGAQRFGSYVGVLSPFFVPRTGDVAPTAKLSTPLGVYEMRVNETPSHPEFGERWELVPPTPWLAVGLSRIAVSTGQVFEVNVAPPRQYLRPAEVRRYRRLTVDQQTELRTQLARSNS